MGRRTTASEARSRLRRAEQARESHVGELLEAQGMVAGSFQRQGRTCGKAGCRCATGARHEAAYLSRKVDGRSEMAYVPAGDVVEVATKAERYRRFRQARAALMKLAAETAQAADALQVALTEPYPKKEARRRRKRH
jgi:hypothetical protein